MENNIYIRLLTEGTIVYRPVSAHRIKDHIYEVKGYDIYDPEDEIWEFPPGSHVLVEERNMDGDLVWVAVANTSKE